MLLISPISIVVSQPVVSIHSEGANLEHEFSRRVFLNFFCCLVLSKLLGLLRDFILLLVLMFYSTVRVRLEGDYFF
jgi:hypothetical protein